MSAWYQDAVYPLLSRIEPERAHQLTLALLHVAGATPGGLGLLRTLAAPSDPRLAVPCFGLDFPNPLGVAAGLDKNAEAVDALLALGFGAVEVGTVTLRPQPGNPRPRLWRLPEQAALINALGFPSDGAPAVRDRLARRARTAGIVGVNLGKNRATPAERAAEDYVGTLRLLWDAADYLTINVSSPNTPGLRDLQQRDALAGILAAVQAANAQMARLRGGRPRPVLVKLAPDLDTAALDATLAGAIDGGADGLVVANTTVDRQVLRGPAPDVPGGISGAPLRARATEMVREVRRRAGPRLPIVGVGGIASAAGVIERMRAGASLVQLYTGFVYGGPALPGRINRDLIAFIEREGLRSIAEIVGADAPSA